MSRTAIIPTRSTFHHRFLGVALGAALVAGCASGGTAGASQAEEATSASASLSQAELDKLDQELRERLETGQDGRFPVRVSFATTPSTDELLELMLTRYERRYGVGRVDRATLQQIASKDNVRQISFVDGLAGAGPEPEEDAVDGG